MPGKQLATDRPAPWESGLVIVDKPGGMTSHDVVARIRRLAHTRRVGHAGTLDPMATGVLVIGVEKATRLLGHLMLTEKTYAATIRLGQSTTTDDAEGEPPAAAPPAGVTRAALDAEIAKLTGEILQVPSSVSAIKVNGQRAYKLTRAGEAPELAARPVTVYEFTVTADPPGRRLPRPRRDGPLLKRHLHPRPRPRPRHRPGHRRPPDRLAPHRRRPLHRRHGAHTQRPREPRSRSRQVAPNEFGAYSRPQAPRDAPPAAPGCRRRRRTPLWSWVTPLADAAAAAFPRLDLTADEARRLAQGARLPLPPASRFRPTRPSSGGHGA